MRASTILVVVSLCGLVGCTARASMGPHLRTGGDRGATGAASVAFGKSVGDYRLLAVGATVQVMADDVTRLGAGANVDYVDAGRALPIRATVRVGGLTRVVTAGPDVDYPTRLAIGAAIAIYPFHSDVRAIPDHDDHDASAAATTWKTTPDDDMLSDMFEGSSDGDDHDDSTATMYGLGVELAVDALPMTAPNDPRELFVSLSVVGELSWMPRPAPRD